MAQSRWCGLWGIFLDRLVAPDRLDGAPGLEPGTCWVRRLPNCSGEGFSQGGKPLSEVVHHLRGKRWGLSGKSHFTNPHPAMTGWFDTGDAATWQ